MKCTPKVRQYGILKLTMGVHFNGPAVFIDIAQSQNRF